MQRPVRKHNSLCERADYGTKPGAGCFGMDAGYTNLEYYEK